MGDVDFGTRIKPGQALTIADVLANAQPFQILPATANRVSIEIQNKSVNICYINTTNAVAVGNGIVLQAATAGNDGDGGVIQVDLGPNETLWVWPAALPSRLCITELIGV